MNIADTCTLLFFVEKMCAKDSHILSTKNTPVENILFTLLCTLHQPNSIDQCLFLAVVNFILAATQVRYF